MDILKELSMAFIWLIRAGTVTRLAYCFIKIIQEDEELGVHKRRMRNALVFLVFAESIWQLKDIAVHYFGG